MKHALVIGGSGFVGYSIVKRLIEAEIAVTVLDLKVGAHVLSHVRKGECTAIEADVSTVADFSAFLTGVDTVFHFASATLPQSSNDNPVLDVEKNLLSFIRLLEALRVHKHIKLVFASSGGTVYGATDVSPIPEASEKAPLCSYGIVKHAMENYMRMYKVLYGVQSVALRMSNPYGPGQDVARPQGVIGVFMDRIAKGQEIVIWGDGSVVRDFIAIEDVTEAFLAAASYAGDQQFFNIGSGEGVSLNQLLDYLTEESGISPLVRRERGRSFDVKSNVLDINLAANELNWKPRIDLKLGISKFWQNYFCR